MENNPSTSNNNTIQTLFSEWSHAAKDTVQNWSDTITKVASNAGETMINKARSVSRLGVPVKENPVDASSTTSSLSGDTFSPVHRENK